MSNQLYPHQVNSITPILLFIKKSYSKPTPVNPRTRLRHTKNPRQASRGKKRSARLERRCCRGGPVGKSIITKAQRQLDRDSGGQEKRSRRESPTRAQEDHPPGLVKFLGARARLIIVQSARARAASSPFSHLKALSLLCAGK